MKNVTNKIYMVVVIAFLLSSCGNKSDLYMPKKDKDKIVQTSKQ